MKDASGVTGEETQPASLRRLAGWAFGLALALGNGHAVLKTLGSGENWMYFEQDDFFYYLKVAQNLAAGHGSTFNGLVLTNGYHPLWLLILTGVVRLGAGPRGIFMFLGATIWVATMMSYALALRLFRSSGMEALVSAALACFVAVYCMHLYVQGMEATLAVPLMLAVLVAVQNVKSWSRPGPRGWWRCAGLGLLVSLMVLARLDSALFALLLVAGVVWQAELRERLRVVQFTGLSAGLLPVGVYVAINRAVFDVWMPISGMAKELKLDRGFSAQALGSVARLSATQKLNIAAIAAVMFALPWLSKKLRAVDRSIAIAALPFPFLYVILLCWLSDWPLWGWYFYGLRVSLCVALLVLFRSRTVSRWAQRPVVLLCLSVLALSRVLTMQWEVQLRGTVDAALELQRFAEMHPGIYAMGDRAGVVGYLLQEPLVQTEGLMMDKAFLQKIAAQEPLRNVLAEQHVRYYVGTAMGPYQGCFQAAEPVQAGKHTPHMRAEFCEQPVARWTHGDNETLVFDLGLK